MITFSCTSKEKRLRVPNSENDKRLALDNSIFWLGYSKQKNPTISIFITDQIKDYYTIIVSDNGPGFNIGTDVAVKPFISGKPDNIGMGIGLHIANEMMNAMGGKLLFYEKEERDKVVKALKKERPQIILKLASLVLELHIVDPPP